jgi:hypothetical protein
MKCFAGCAARFTLDIQAVGQFGVRPIKGVEVKPRIDIYRRRFQKLRGRFPSGEILLRVTL